MTGIAMISSQMGVCWAVAMALTGVTDLDIYYALCLLLPHVMEYFLTATPTQFVSIARSLGEDVKDISVIEAAIKAVEGVRKLFMEVNIPARLSDFDIPKSQIADIAEAAMAFTQIKNGPRAMTRNDIESLLLSAF